MLSKYSKTPPKEDEIEASLFGPGFGESIAVHFGGGRWAVIDSCINRIQNRPAALVYFDEIGVNPEQQIDLIVVSHWHDDHVAGIDQVVSECKSAEFWCSDSLRCQEFLALFELSFTRPDIKFTRGVSCISKIVDLIGPRFKFALAGMRIYRRSLGIGGQTVPVEVWTLSPSQYENYLAKKHISTLVAQRRGPQMRVPDRNPNHTAVVVDIIVGDQSILLGADLEEPGDARLGWSAILSNSSLPNTLSSVFKIPHHGSITAHHDGVWRSLLSSNRVAVVTPYRVGRNVLPQSSDIDRITSFTANSFVSSTSYSVKSKRRSNLLHKYVGDRIRSQRTIPGHIRLRRPIFGAATNWEVSLYDGAAQLRDFKPT